MDKLFDINRKIDNLKSNDYLDISNIDNPLVVNIFHNDKRYRLGKIVSNNIKSFQYLFGHLTDDKNDKDEKNDKNDKNEKDEKNDKNKTSIPLDNREQGLIYALPDIYYNDENLVFTRFGSDKKIIIDYISSVSGYKLEYPNSKRIRFTSNYLVILSDIEDIEDIENNNQESLQTKVNNNQESVRTKGDNYRLLYIYDFTSNKFDTYLLTIKIPYEYEINETPKCLAVYDSQNILFKFENTIYHWTGEYTNETYDNQDKYTNKLYDNQDKYTNKIITIDHLILITEDVEAWTANKYLVYISKNTSNVTIYDISKCQEIGLVDIDFGDNFWDLNYSISTFGNKICIYQYNILYDITVIDDYSIVSNYKFDNYIHDLTYTIDNEIILIFDSCFNSAETYKRKVDKYGSERVPYFECEKYGSERVPYYTKANLTKSGKLYNIINETSIPPTSDVKFDYIYYISYQDLINILPTFRILLQIRRYDVINSGFLFTYLRNIKYYDIYTDRLLFKFIEYAMNRNSEIFINDKLDFVLYLKSNNI